MDGYTLTEKMRRARRKFRLTATEQALFHELVAVCNDEGWKDIFDCSNMELCFALNINERTLLKSRDALIVAGLIYYKSGKSKRAVSSYSFVKPFKEKKKTTLNFTTDQTTNEATNTTTNEATNEAVKQPDYIKTNINETKTKDIPHSPPQGYENFNFDFVEEKYRSAFSDWLAYKRERKEKYKTQRSLELCYRKMIQLGNNDLGVTQLVVEQSMAANWAGLFELKTNRNYGKKQSDDDNCTNAIIRSTDG